MKRGFNLYIDIDVFLKTKESVGNVSAWVENAMIDYLNSKEGKKDG